MIKNLKAILSLALGIAAIAFTLYACKKNKAAGEIITDKEILLFEDKDAPASYDPADLFLGGNIKRVTSIGYDHSILDVLKRSPEWKRAMGVMKPDLDNIKRTYVYNTDASLITVPVRGDGSEAAWFNIYLQQDKLLITKLSERRNAEGLVNYKVQSQDGALYYQFDLNDKNQLGNWKFERDLPKIFTAGAQAGNLLTAKDEPCAKKKFNKCMGCFILDVCGSDWMCTVACGVAVASCVAGAALACLIG